MFETLQQESKKREGKKELRKKGARLRQGGGMHGKKIDVEWWGGGGGRRGEGRKREPKDEGEGGRKGL